VTPALLEVNQLAVSVRRGGANRTVVADVSFQVAAGEALGVVGESGSGKSMSMLALLQLLPEGARAHAACARFDGVELLTLEPERISRLRGRQIGIVFQDPLTALNPVLTIGRQITEVIRRHFPVSRADARERAGALLARVGIAEPLLRLRQYPHEFSGGMRQRVAIAMALAAEPRLLIADEPTTALDVTSQAAIVELIDGLRRNAGLAVIWVTHDLALLARFAERVIVMYGGRVVEEDTAERLFAAPRHPYTRLLLSNLKPEDSAAANAPAQAGAVPGPGSEGCPFVSRCIVAMERCGREPPPFRALQAGGRVACWAVP
jgi:oligopeptide/dipeptide ABC transporter ATP-binding protein